MAIAPRFALALLLAATGAGVAGFAADPTTTGTLPTIEELLSPTAWGKVPSQIAWSPDGKRLSYLWDDGQGEALWVLDPVTGKSEKCLSGADLAEPQETSKEKDKAEPAAVPPPPSVGEVSWLPDGKGFLVASDGDLFLALAGAAPRRLTRTAAAEEGAVVSSKGDRAAFVRDHDLWTLDLATGREQRQTRDGKENVTLNGETDWVYWEEIWNRDSTGFWWHPDGRRIAYYRFDETPVGVYPLIDDVPKDATVRWQKYPRPGRPNPRVKIGVRDTTSARAKTIWMETGGAPDDYLARVAWSHDGSWLAIERLNRDQTELDLLRCTPADGHCTVLASDRDPDWVNLGNDFRPLEDGRFLWSSEREGHRRLYLYAADGKPLGPVTPEGWVHETLDGVDEAQGLVTFTGYATEPLLAAAERHVLRARLDGSGLERLTSGRGWHTATVAPSGGWWVDGWSDADTPPLLRLIGPDGREAAARLPSKPSTIDTAGLPKYEFLTIPGPEGSTLPARLLKPAGFDPARKVPVLTYHYGGPASQVVIDRWGGAWNKWMAARGYAVWSVDNQASLFFGKRGEVRLHRRFGELELAGQLAGVAYLKAQPWVDGGRLGIWGWSGGGSNTLYALLHSPGTWKVGVAGAPVTDWLLYDSIWTERYFDRPEENPEGYRLSSAVTAAANLKDRLLIVHGTADDNVHPQNSWNLIRALEKAHVSYEDLALPGQSHGIRGDAQIHFYRRMTELFDRELGGGTAH
ncbi:MAG TPA: DPP IV N-terminal domain-containing protein [Thermoanaerobaculia bacterium]|jgi:dipeptidyl-peptidase-4|nr:DPP IV N-terminal domain-containing protein [Thermoanaerobaculia bacterium]